MNDFPDHCYWVRHVPIERIWYKTEHLVWEDTDWCMKLEESIRKEGLFSPILIDNHPDRKHRIARETGVTDEFHVYCGHHRVQACERIGWKYLPCVVHGAAIPDEWNGEWIPHVHRVKELMRDGRVNMYHERIQMIDTMLPEDMVYPDVPAEPYWPTEPEPPEREETLEDELEEYT